MSRLSETLKKLGLSNQPQQAAFLDILQMADYLSPQNLWESVHCLGESFGKDRHEPQDAYQALQQKIHEEKLPTPALLENLFEDPSVFDEQDITDLVTYWAQTAFARNQGQERIQLQKADWMDKHKDLFWENAKILGMIDEICPSLRTHFDLAAIQGAARPTVHTRFNYFAAKNFAADSVIAMTGNRDLSIPLDGMGAIKTERMNEGADYIFNLADAHKIDCLGFVENSGMFYLRYPPEESRRVTEAMMIDNVVQSHFPQIYDRLHISNYAAARQKGRPTTFSSGAFALNKYLAEHPHQEEIHILVVSNQPYAARQVMSLQRAFNSLNITDKEVFFYTAGPECQADVSVINSEFGATAGERYYLLCESEKRERKRPDNRIMYQHRQKILESIPVFTGP